jgi:MtfA peptidase
LRVDRPSDRWLPATTAGLMAAAGAGLGAVAFHALGAVVGVASGLVVGLALHERLRRRRQKRRRVLATPFPAAWREVLERECDHYHRLPPELRARFEDDLRLFLDETRITGVDVEVTDELRILVGASAVTLSLGWPSFEWEPLTEVLLYPQDFDRDWSFERTDLAGQAHGWGTVILSVPTLRESFACPDDAHHVGLHEFAHLLDLDRGQFSGVPTGLPSALVPEWEALVKREMHRLERRKSVIDPYGLENPVEFLAVAVEAFFEIPLLVRERHRELYDILSSYFVQDPARWDEERGL